MATISLDLVKELRDRTGVGFGDCKNALTEADGDIEGAIELLRKKGIAKAAKRAENVTSEGKVKVRVAGNTAYVAVIGCETDFVSRNPAFDEMVEKFLDIRVASASDEAALASVEAIRGDYVLRIGENIRIITLTAVSGDAFGVYVHSNMKVGAVVVAKAGTDTEKLKQVAMHVVASNPEVLSPDDISDATIAKEKDIQLALMQEDPKNAGKPTEILEKIIEGKMTKFREENALLTQPFVINPDQKVRDFIGADTLVSFARFAI